MEPLGLIVFILILFIGYLLDDEEETIDPLNLALPSVEHLEAEAWRAAKELHQIDREGE
jgi:hypothetical protein